MRFLASLAALLLLAGAAHAQTTVRQSGQVTPGHVGTWTTNGVIQDGGTPANPKITGGVGVVSPNAESICTQSALTGPITKLCLGSTSSGGLISLDNQGGASGTLSYSINGNIIPFQIGPVNLPFLSAQAFGVIADGTTPMDAQMASALAACAALGSALYLPPGSILLTGTQSLQVHNCALVGSGITTGPPPLLGTTFLITSTTTSPFTIGSNWSMAGINFYWPGQTTGLIAYPALMTMAPGASSTHWSMDHINIINGYDGIVGGSATGTGSWIISNSWMWVLHDLFRLPFVGDSIHLTGIQMTPGIWLNICGFSAPCKAAVDAKNNSIFRVNNVLNVSMDNIASFAWVYGFKLETGAVVSLSNINLEFDGMATLIDASAGGFWSGLNILSGAGDCNNYQYTTNAGIGNAPCFNMGATSELSINRLYVDTAAGSFFLSSGGNLKMTDSSVARIGGVLDGGDYYIVHTTANPGGLLVSVQNSVLAGRASSTKTHGIVTDVLPTRLIVQNNHFEFLNEEINVQSAPTTEITGNWSQGTTGAVSVAISGNNGVIYGNNNWDKPPSASISAGPGATISGAVSGRFLVGSTNPTTVVVFTLPWVPYGAGNCIFAASNGVPWTGVPLNLPQEWTLTFSSTVHNQFVYFNCPSQQ